MMPSCIAEIAVVFHDEELAGKYINEWNRLRLVCDATDEEKQVMESTMGGYKAVVEGWLYDYHEPFYPGEFVRLAQTIMHS